MKKHPLRELSEKFQGRRNKGASKESGQGNPTPPLQASTTNAESVPGMDKDEQIARLTSLLGAAQDQILLLQGRLRASDAVTAGVKSERDFWMEQSRTAQNQLQTVMRGQAGILDQIARTTLSPEDVISHLNQVAQELRQPLTTVEAVAAVISMNKSDTQGNYTSVAQKLAVTGDVRLPRAGA